MILRWSARSPTVSASCIWAVCSRSVRRHPAIAEPLHPYTQMLVSAVPLPDPVQARGRRRILMRGEPPSPVQPPAGCYLHPRCRPRHADLRTVVPEWTEPRPGQFAACHLHE